MNAQTSQRVGRVMTIIRHENPEFVKDIIQLIRSGVVFEDFPQNIKTLIIKIEREQGL